jgi:hypothetical protein
MNQGVYADNPLQRDLTSLLSAARGWLVNLLSVLLRRWGNPASNKEVLSSSGGYGGDVDVTPGAWPASILATNELAQWRHAGTGYTPLHGCRNWSRRA